MRKLVEAGFDSAAAVAAATVEQLSEISGIGGKTTEKIIAAANGGGDAPSSNETDSTETV